MIKSEHLAPPLDDVSPPVDELERRAAARRRRADDRSDDAPPTPARAPAAAPSVLTIDFLRPFFETPMIDAAAKLGLCARYCARARPRSRPRSRCRSPPLCASKKTPSSSFVRFFFDANKAF